MIEPGMSKKWEIGCGNRLLGRKYSRVWDSLRSRIRTKVGKDLLYLGLDRIKEPLDDVLDIAMDLDIATKWRENDWDKMV